MALSLEVPGLPQFLTLGHLDDELFLPSNENSSRTDFLKPRAKSHRRVETWAKDTEDLQEKEEQLKWMLAKITVQSGQDVGE